MIIELGVTRNVGEKNICVRNICVQKIYVRAFLFLWKGASVDIVCKFFPLRGIFMLYQKKIALASVATAKINACKQIFQNAHIEACKAPSNVSNQPLSREETFTGAQYRLQNLRALSSRESELFIAIENGIWKIGDEYYDTPVVMIQGADPFSSVLSVTGESVYIPLHYAAMACDLKGVKTIGTLLMEDALIVDHQDPHSYLTAGKVSREYILAAVLKKAFMAYRSL